MKTFKILLFFLAVISCAFFQACKKENLNPIKQDTTNSTDGVGKTAILCEERTTTDLMLNESDAAGYITINNDIRNLYVTYTVFDSWRLHDLRLYLGDLRLVPLNKDGNPNTDLFPFKQRIERPQQNYTFIIPMTSLNNCFSVLAQAYLYEANDFSGEMGGRMYVAWGKGKPIGSRVLGGMYFDACKQSCATEETLPDIE